MNILAWALSLTLLVLLLIQAVEFQRSTVCRQEAWRKSLELKTKTLLFEPQSHEKDWHLVCRLYLTRKQDEISWQRLPGLANHRFDLTLDGNL